VGGDSPKAGWAALLGALSVATLPIAIAATRFSGAYDLLHAGLAIPIGLGLGWGALVQARKSRSRAEASLASTEGRRKVSAGRILGILGICMASSATIAVAVYGVLTYLD
jgi:hypothetical protein